jgi:soluble lytic murein transglycosylase-like protein
LSLILLGTSSWCSADVGEYLIKHKDIKVRDYQLERLAKYEHLMEEFGAISWFKPNHTVSAAFLKALVLAESDGDPEAVSKDNAIGLCQITLETGQDAINELGPRLSQFSNIDIEKVDNFSAESLKDPAINLLLCSYLVAKYNHFYSGRLDLVVSAWNAGEGATNRAGGVPEYSETQDLVGKINGLYWYFLNNDKS